MVRKYPELLSTDEEKALHDQAHELFRRLEANDLGGLSGFNRPYWIIGEFKRVIEQFGRRDVGYTWTKDELDAAKPGKAPKQWREAIGWDRAVASAATAAENYSTRQRLDANLMGPCRERDEARAMQTGADRLAKRIKGLPNPYREETTK